jgi:hypothetical protein
MCVVDPYVYMTGLAKSRIKKFNMIDGGKLVISRSFKSKSSEFLTQGFFLQKSVEMCSIMEIPWNDEAVLNHCSLGS